MVVVNRNLLLFVILLAFSVAFLSFIDAVNCYAYTSSATCTTSNGCLWKNDSWNTNGWCEELQCWSLSSQSSCASTNVAGKNCTWQAGGTSYSCEEISCWSFSGTNNNSCISNTANKSCSWSDSCYNVGGGSTNCWSITNQSTCSNTTGCAWGQCQERGCWSNANQSSCTNSRDFKGGNCTWVSSGSYCKESNCWDSTSYPNQTACESASGISCEWKWGSCQEKDCWSFDFTNETACENNTISKSCVWSNSYCSKDSCWGATANASCAAKNGCRWASWTTSGWCEEVSCWTWDSMRGGNQTKCEGLDSNYGLTCLWSGNPPGNLTNGWCYKDVSTTSCSNITTERACFDTYYCWWQANNWSDSSQGGNCTNPTWGTGSFSNISGSILNDWNPGCYIFDLNSTKCNNLLGCNYTSNVCDELNNSYGVNITNDGIKCSYINDSQLCNDIAVLSGCCSWQNGTCAENKYSTSCVSQLDQTPNGEESCEDAETKADCETIANDPWYMPCKWNNLTNKCKFKIDDIFGNSSQSIVKIESKRNCEAAGGKWITDNYCEGAVSVPIGRCEYKFDDEENCDKACFACETEDSNGNLVNSSNAESACLNSRLGYCEFENNSIAPNGMGFCKAKKEFRLGIAGDCNNNCGDCAFLGNPASNASKDSSNNCLTPSCFCSESQANSAGGGCKWISGNNTATGGYCLNKGVKTCQDACDRCKTRDDCANDGRSALNSSGSCKWEGTDNDGSCLNNVAGDVEICWDGVDNDDDELIDCSDAGCYSDSWCGFVSGDCFGWSAKATCESNDCEWVNDSWNPTGWCEFKGSQCWKYDESQDECLGATSVNETLNITSSRLAGNEVNISKTFTLSNKGTGWVLNSVVITNTSGTSLAGNFTVNYTAQTIDFSNNTFMISGGGSGNITNVSYQYYANRSANCDWSNGTGTGWCERDWSVAETCFTAKNATSCSTTVTPDNKNCTWTNDTWCSGTGGGSTWCDTQGGWCDHPDFKPKNCWQQSDNSSCSVTTGCSWKIDQWSQQRCEVNWSTNCWQYSNSTSCGVGCWWRTDTTMNGSTNSWCTNNFDRCWSQYNETGCSSVSQVSCNWRNYSGGSGGTCEPSCSNKFDQNSCTTVSGCVWKEGGWCEEQQSQTCYNTTLSNNQTACQSTQGCNWNNPGWCDPKGGGFSSGAFSGTGGVGGSTGSECYKYDGNQSLCTNETIINTSCGWSPEPNPRCDIDWSTNCWQYSNSSSCDTGGCWWNPTGNYCTNKMDQCWSNTTLTNNATLCNANSLCGNNSWGGCEPKCISQTTQNSCTSISGCKWMSGWCNSAGMNDMFDEMESGGSAPLGMDGCGVAGEPTQASIDICGFGMKDMGDGYGFGANMYDFSNASVCNKEKISSYVFGSGGGSEKIGIGTDTIVLFVYIDTDGSATGGCELSHNSSAGGYEFRFRYVSEWNSINAKSVETFNAYACENSKWVASDIKLSAWRKIMCSEIGGPMIGIEKSELSRFPILYDSTKDMRVYVASINNTENVSSPSDTAGPNWATPGTIDFEVVSAFDYGADNAKFEDILKKGFVGNEDCFNSIDDDSDGSTDCNDWDCQFLPVCSSKGVNAANYTDTQTPQVTGVKIEEYPDSALVMYDTNKPSNGTLEFYGNDSRCIILNKTIYDIGITSTKVRDYKSWHTAEIYSSTLGYSLTNNTKYYFKLKICDNANKCAISRCSSFVTAESSSKCGYCNFVTRIKTSSSWTVSYDVNQDGTYEHVQGQVCGDSSGVKSNYTMRRVNIKLVKSDGSTYFEFINSSLTKTGLNDKVRSISDSGDIISSSSLVGLTSETRDKIINNLHPEVCRVKIPSSGGCSTLQHCDDSGANCVDRTSEATLLDSANCVWELPYCEFSTYKTTSTSSTSSSSSGGGGSGGATIGGTTTIISESQLSEGYTKQLATKDKIKFNVSNESHTMEVMNVTSSTLTVKVTSTPQTASVSLGETKKFEL
ncbi:MAG TPA: hypothetical protein VJH92_00005, partial [Candidatus Nanoarchaeia archaeon]|nr:hypothetical protein [Candidatus Nanoarchaeia archaeon]